MYPQFRSLESKEEALAQQKPRNQKHNQQISNQSLQPLFIRLQEQINQLSDDKNKDTNDFFNQQQTYWSDPNYFKNLNYPNKFIGPLQNPPNFDAAVGQPQFEEIQEKQNEELKRLFLSQIKGEFVKQIIQDEDSIEKLPQKRSLNFELNELNQNLRKRRLESHLLQQKDEQAVCEVSQKGEFQVKGLPPLKLTKQTTSSSDCSDQLKVSPQIQKNLINLKNQTQTQNEILDLKNQNMEQNFKIEKKSVSKLFCLGGGAGFLQHKSPAKYTQLSSNEILVDQLMENNNNPKLIARIKQMVEQQDFQKRQQQKNAQICIQLLPFDQTLTSNVAQFPYLLCPIETNLQDLKEFVARSFSSQNSINVKLYLDDDLLEDSSCKLFQLKNNNCRIMQIKYSCK